MKKILKEFHLIQAQLIEKHYTAPEQDSVAAIQYRVVLQQNGVSIEQFEESYRYYEKHPEQFLRIYDTMIAEYSLAQSISEALKTYERENVVRSLPH